MNGFSARVFTYLLTQYLWQQTSTVENAIAYAVQKIPQKFNQTPRYEVKVGSGYEKQPIYFSNTSGSAANAVITEVKGNKAKLWLGGINPAELDNGTVFTIITSKGAGKVTFQSRDGLVEEAIIEGNVEPGMLLQKAS